MEFIAPQSLKRQIADEIRRRIICGEVEFGQKLSENSFAAELGVKRTPVREAFILLQGESLVDIVPQKGIYPISKRFFLPAVRTQSLRRLMIL